MVHLTAVCQGSVAGMGRVASMKVEDIDVDYLLHLAYGQNKYS